MNPLNSSHRPLGRPGTQVKDPRSLPDARLWGLPSASSALTGALVVEGQGRSCHPALSPVHSEPASSGFLLWQVEDFPSPVGFLFPHVSTAHLLRGGLCALPLLLEQGPQRERERELLVITPTTYQTLFICQVPCGHLIQ